MLDSVIRFVRGIFPSSREEWRKASLMFLYFFLTISTIYVFKPVRDSLFVSVHGAENMWLGYVGEPFAALIATYFFTLLARRINKKNLFFSVLALFFVLNIFIFLGLFRSGYADTEWLVYLFYLWATAYSITIVTQFWTLANDIFNPQEAKRMFGLIISGGGLGGIAGSLLTKTLVGQIGTENLLLIPAVTLVLCVILIQVIWKYERPIHGDESIDRRGTNQSSRISDRHTWKLFFDSRYLILIAGVVVLAKMSSTFVDNQYKGVVEQAFVNKDSMTEFFATVNVWVNAASWPMQLIIGGAVLRYLGVGVSLFLLPVGLCFGAVGVAFAPLLGAAAGTKIFDGSMNYSVQKMGQEILYLPVPRKTRYRVKPLIDIFFYRSSRALAGILILCATRLVGVSTEKLGIFVLVLAPLWLLVVWQARREYLHAIRKLLVDKGAVVRPLRREIGNAAEVFVNLTGEHSFEKLKEFIDHRSSVTRKMSATACLAYYSGSRDVNRVNRLVEEMMRYEALELKGVELDELFQEGVNKKNGILDKYLVRLLQAFKDPKMSPERLLRKEEKEILLKLSEYLSDPNQEIREKRKAIMILTTLGTQGAVDILLNSLASAQDHSIRFNLIRSLNRIRAKEGGRRDFNSWIIKKEILNEIKHCHALMMVVDEYTLRKAIARPEDDYLFATLKALREESLERIFRLLSLLYSSDVIHVIYDRLLEHEPDKHIRANALELLENVIEPELTRKLRPIFDETDRARTADGKLQETIRSFLGSQDRWLQACSVFLIVELGLGEFYTELEDSARARTPIVREAAEIALAKIGRKT
jgi:ATP/ADP translocase